MIFLSNETVDMFGFTITSRDSNNIHKVSEFISECDMEKVSRTFTYLKNRASMHSNMLKTFEARGILVGYSGVNEYRNFIFMKPLNWSDRSDDIKYMSLPFKKTSFEVYRYLQFHSLENGVLSFTCGILFEEKSPLEFKITVNIFFIGKNGEFGFSNNFTTNPDELRPLLSVYMKELDRGFFSNKSGEVLRYRDEKRNKKKSVIKDTVYVFRNKKEADDYTKKTGDKTDYSHRFEVRGHWRKIQRMGKCREGCYCTWGYTWVKDFEKGNKNLPLVKKTRLLITGGNHVNYI